MPALSPSFETIPGNDTSGSVCGLPLGCVLGDPNSIVSDAAESRTKVTKFLIFVFIGHYDSLQISPGDLEGRTERTTEEREIFTLFA